MTTPLSKTAPSDDVVLADRSIRDFGEQWTRYPDNIGYYGSLELFSDLIRPLLTLEDFRDRRVAEIGSGTGRVVRMLAAAGVAHVAALEPSAAIDVLKRNTVDLVDRVQYVHARGEALPGESEFDLVVSFGVLHHIPDPRPVVRRAFEALRPGGRMMVWLYGREGNEAYLALARPLRAVTQRLPHSALAALCRLLDLPLVAYLHACRHLALPMRAYMNSHLARLSPEIRRLTIYDQLNPAWAKYYRRDEAVALLEDSGFVDVRTHHRHGYSWSVLGRKP